MINIRKLIHYSFYTTILLFIVFHYIEIIHSLVIFSFLITGLITIKIYEFYSFYKKRKEHLKLGKTKIFNPILRGIYTFSFFVIIAIFFNQYGEFQEYQTTFSKFFKNKNYHFGIFIAIIVKDVLFKDNLYYFSGNKIITQGNHFKTYSVSDFKDYVLIENQNLIRLEKRNKQFLFIEYDEIFFKEHKKEIIKNLDVIKHKNNG